MRLMITITSAAMLAVLSACGNEATDKSASQFESQPAPQPQSESAKEHSATGTVDSLSGSEVKISHEAIQSIGWPAMTMSFTAKEAAQLEGIKAGDRVSFSFVKSDDTSKLTAISKQ